MAATLTWSTRGTLPHITRILYYMLIKAFLTIILKVHIHKICIVGYTA